jgi:hypothetical protein
MACTESHFGYEGGGVGVVECDGRHPTCGSVCVLGEHKGFHQAADGTHWLDD